MLIEQIAPRLKPSDVKATRIFGFDDPAAALRVAFERGEVLFMGMVNGEPCAVVSVIPKEHTRHEEGGEIEGSIWMMTTPEFSEAPVAVLRKSLRMIKRLLTPTPFPPPSGQGNNIGANAPNPLAEGPEPKGVSLSNPLASVASLSKGRELPRAISYRALDTVIDRSDPVAIHYALFLGFEDWGVHYDTTIGEATLGYFRKDRK